MPRCVLIVDFRIKPGQRDAFLATMTEHARRTLAEEPGCLQFDVLLPEEGADRVMLVEVYDDRAAYEAHRQNPRMPSVGAAIDPLLESRTLTICRLA